MMDPLQVALSELGPSEEAAPGTFGSVLPVRNLPEMTNYASDERVRAMCSEMHEVMDWTRQDRRALEEEWEQTRNMVMLRHDKGRRYYGRSDYYLPLYRRERSKLVSLLSRGLFPSDDYFDVSDRQTGDPERAKPVKAYMQWEMERNARVRTFIKPFLYQLQDCGTSVLKTWYAKDLIRSEGTVKSLLPNLLGGAPDAQFGFKNCYYDGMRVSPRNLLYWYIYPTTAESVEQAQLIFEDIDVPRAYALYMRDMKRWQNVDEALGRYIQTEHDRQQREMLGARGTGMSPPGLHLPDSALPLTVTECWGFMNLPASAYLPHEDKRLPLPVRVVMVDDCPVEVVRNPSYHQRPPYDVARIDWESGFFYGTAGGKLFRGLQCLANDFMNQTNDNSIYAMNPIPLVDVNYLHGTLPRLAPGVPIYVTDVEKALKFERPPWEQAQWGLQQTQFVMGLAQDLGGAPPDRAAQSKGARTATGIQILQQNSLSPLQDVVEDIEGDVMVPMLIKGWKNGIQYRDQSVMAIVAGEPVQIDPAQLAIDADFRWSASSQAVNAQMRAQKAMQLIQSILPVVPLIMQQGYVIDFVSLVRKVYVDGMGFRGFNEFIRKAQAAPGAMPGQPIRPDQLGGVRAEQQDNVRSALDNLGGETPMAPGEGEAFGEVRDQADEMAGAMGGMNGMGGGGY